MYEIIEIGVDFLNGVLNKLNNIFSKNKFEAELKSEVKNLGFSISYTDNPNEILLSNDVSSFNVDLYNIRNAKTPEEASKYIEVIKSECDMRKRLVSFTNAQNFLRFLAVDSKEITKSMIYTDFVGDIKKVMVYTNDNERLFFLDNKIIEKWAVPREVLFSVADRNMSVILNSAELKTNEITNGVNGLEIVSQNNMLTSSFMMCGNFRNIIHKRFGPKFLVLAPSRNNMMILDNITNNLLEKLSTVVVKDYRHSEFPLTTDVLLFLPDTIKIAGHFKTSAWD